MNSEALESRQLCFKCMAPATQRGHQLYSQAVREAKILFQRVVARKREEKKKMPQKSHHPEQAVPRGWLSRVSGSVLTTATFPCAVEGSRWVPSCSVPLPTHLISWNNVFDITFLPLRNIQKHTLLMQLLNWRHSWVLKTRHQISTWFC